jgi:hypothetical protein
MHIRLLLYNPETNEFGVTLTQKSKPFISLPNVTKQNIAGLKLFKLRVQLGSYKCSIAVHVGPILSVGTNKVIPIGFELFKFIMTNYTEFTEQTSDGLFEQLLKSDVQSRIPGFSELDFESKPSDAVELYRKLFAFTNPKTVHDEAPEFVSEPSQPSKKHKPDPNYPSIHKFSHPGRDESVSDDEWNKDTL